MAGKPGDYPWSSHAANTQGKQDDLAQPHDVYLALGRNEDDRQRAYREPFRQELEAADVASLRNSVNLCVPVGNDKFKSQIERRLKQRISYRPRGRPRREPAEGGQWNG